MIKKRNLAVLLIIFICVLISQNLNGQDFSNTDLPTYDQVLDSMEVQFLRIQDYRVTVDVVMDVKGIHIPPMLVTIFFKQPDKIHFESRGFAILPRNAVMASPLQFRKLATEGEVLGVEEIDKQKLFHLRLFPQVEDKNISVLIDFWVDVAFWIIKKMRIESNEFGWLEINNEFQVIDNTFRLPKKSHVKMEVDRETMTKFRTQVPMDPELQFSKPSILNDLFGTGQMFITFRNYKINSGLSDKIFEEQKK